MTLSPKIRSKIKSEERFAIKMDPFIHIVVYADFIPDNHIGEIFEIAKKFIGKPVTFNLVGNREDTNFYYSVINSYKPGNCKFWEKERFDTVCELSDFAILWYLQEDSDRISNVYCRWGLDFCFNNNIEEFINSSILQIIPEEATITERKKEPVVILSHADTNEKLYLLSEAIREVHKKGYPIILSTHIQVPDNLYKICDYVIYDSNNALITGKDFETLGCGMIFIWARYPGYYQSFQIDYNHSYAVLRLMKNAMGVSEANGYKITHFINYDNIIYDPMLLEKHSTFLNSGDDLYSYYSPENLNYMKTTCFSVRNDIFLKAFSNINTKEDFCLNGSAVLEEFMFQKFSSVTQRIQRTESNTLTFKNYMDPINLHNFSITKFYEELDGYRKCQTQINASKDSNGYYLFIRTEDSISIRIKSSKDTFLISPSLNIPYVIAVPEIYLTNGIHFLIPEYNHEMYINSETKMADCVISDKSIIIPISNFIASTPN